MEENKKEQLKERQIEFRNNLKILSKQKKLDDFILKLQGKFKLKITQKSFPFSEIACPTLYDLPNLPKYTRFVINSSESENQIALIIKQWFSEQESKTFLIRNNHLINIDDWLEIDSINLLQNFSAAIIEFDLFHTLIFSPSSKNFINIFEFENEVIFYKGNISKKTIKYYC